MTLYTGNVQFFVEVGLAAASVGGVWDTAIWDTDVWAGGEPDWVDITDRCLSAATETGRQFWTDRFQTGRARFLMDNTDGAFSPIAGAKLPGDLEMRPGRWIRLRAQSASGGSITPDPVPIPNGTTWTDSAGNTWTANGTGLTYQGPDVPGFLDKVLWVGQVERLTETYPRGGSDSVTELTAVDFQSYLAQYNPPELTVALPVELSSARVDRLLTDAGWDLGRDIQTGQHLVDASTVGTNYAQEIQECARAEGGAFWADGTTFRFRPFGWLTTDPRSITVQAWPGRGLDGDPNIVDINAEWSIQDIANDIQLARRQSSTDIQRQVGSTSQTLYGTRTYRYTALYNESNNDVIALAQRRLALGQWDYQRILGLTLTSLDDAQAAGTALQMQIGDLLAVTVPLTLLGWGYTTETHVQGIGYAVSGTDWSCILRVDHSMRENPSDAQAYDDGFDEGYS